MSEWPDSIWWVLQWIKKAENDLLNAEHTLNLGENCPVDTVCFHAQQCAEKYLKAWLVFCSEETPRTHDLIILLQQTEQDGLMGVDAEWLFPLNRYNVEARYPGDWGPIDRSEAEDAVGYARKVRDSVRNALPNNVLEG